MAAAVHLLFAVTGLFYFLFPSFSLDKMKAKPVLTCGAFSHSFNWMYDIRYLLSLRHLCYCLRML